MSSSDNKQVIILKCDDFVLAPQWERFIQYCEDSNLKVCFGVVGRQLYNEALCTWIKTLGKNTIFEFWNHGLTHDCGDYPEFNGSPFEDQLAHLQEAQRLFREKTGITFYTFGAPCNQIDENTSRALTDFEDVKIWFFGKKSWSGLFLPRRGEIEFPYMWPDFNKFLESYNQNRLEQYDCLVFQLHPGFWDEARFGEFEKVMDFFYDKGVVFMTSLEYYQSLTTTITVTNNSDGGPGSLRAAIDQVNKEQPQNAVIILPAGTYYLTGLKDEDKNAGGDLDIAANLTLQGDSPGSTIIDGSRNDRVLDIHGGRVNISGVTVRNGKAGSGGGIRVKGGTVTIRNCIITGNTIAADGSMAESAGGGIYAENTRITITGCTISNNKGNSAAGIKGGGIYINQNNSSSRADTRNCLIEGNTANTDAAGTGRGGGLYLLARNPNYEVTVFNNTFKKNIASTGGQGEGGGVYLRETGNAYLTGNSFLENTASVNGNGYGGAVFADGGATFNMTNNLLSKNNAGSAGSGIYLKGNPGTGADKSVACTMIHNTLAQNTPAAGANGNEGLFAGDYVTLSLTNNVICRHNKGIYFNAISGSSTVTADTNLFYNSSDPVVGDNALLQDPLLDSDWKPGENSPVVDAGVTVGEVTRDREGTIRPQGKGYDLGCYEYLPVVAPFISLDKTLFNFAGSGANVTGGQSFRVSNGGSGVLNWSAAPGESWLHVDPTTGTGTGIVTITAAPTGLTPGTYAGTISVSAPGASNSPQTVNVYLTVYKPGLTGSPFGYFAAPGNEGTVVVAGAIPLTGWALDDIQVEKVEIYREQGKSLVYVDEAIFIAGARPDVEQAYPDHPFNYKAGWGYMLLTNFLPNQGNGTFIFHALATDTEGHHVTLGTRTISCDNAHAVKPFGTIDIPGQGGSISGKSFANWGWVLTPQPNQIPTDGSTINVWLDGVNLGHPYYNIYRSDIAGLFPDYLNSDGASGYFYLNTSAFENGLHTMQWTAEDSAGNKDGIGSRYILIRNDEDSYNTLNTADSEQSEYAKLAIKKEDLAAIPPDYQTPLSIKKGFRESDKPQQVYPDDEGIFHINIEELERLEIQFPTGNPGISGYQLVGDRAGPLPIGSTLDSRTMTFNWLPGPGFVGLYRLNFLFKDYKGEFRRLDVIIDISMKLSN